MEKYRKDYQEFYGIELSSDMDIHHIDGNHKNNDMDNLIAIPSSLHAKLHAALAALDTYASSTLGFYIRQGVKFSAMGGASCGLATLCREIPRLESILDEVRVWGILRDRKYYGNYCGETKQKITMVTPLIYPWWFM